jgi:hypothetical protein
MNQLWIVTKYAKRLQREVLFQMSMYSATKLSSVFDFSKYPVKVHVDESAEKILQRIATTGSVHPQEYTLHSATIDSNAPKVSLEDQKGLEAIPRTTLLVHDTPGGGYDAQYAFLQIQFQESFLQSFYRHYSLPPVYHAIHIRNTDYTTNLEYADSQIRVFKANHSSNPIFIITDNPATQQEFAQRYSLQKTKTHYFDGSILHSNGKTDSNVLQDVLYDLFIIALSNDFLAIQCAHNKITGFAILATALHEQKRKMKQIIKYHARY